MSPIDAIAVLVLLLVPVNLGVATFMVLLTHRHPELSTLRSRTFVQVVCAIGSTIGGLLAIFDLGRISEPPGVFVLLLTSMILLFSLPGLHWTYVFARDGF